MPVVRTAMTNSPSYDGSRRRTAASISVREGRFMSHLRTRTCVTPPENRRRIREEPGPGGRVQQDARINEWAPGELTRRRHRYYGCYNITNPHARQRDRHPPDRQFGRGHDSEG